MGMTAEYIEGLQRDPHHVFSNRVRYVNYGSCYYFKPMTKKEFLRVDPFDACAFFSQCFRNPREFTVVLVRFPPPADTTSALLPRAFSDLLSQYISALPRSLGAV